METITGQIAGEIFMKNSISIERAVLPVDPFCTT